MVYIIAEAGVNHNGSKKMAYDLVDLAAHAGANAVKFQTFQAGLLATPGLSKAKYQIENDSNADDQFQMLKRLELPYEWHHDLKKYAESFGIDFLSTPFDYESANFLERLNLKYIKVSSADLFNLPFLYRLAKINVPLILSTGMSTLKDIELALATIAYAICSNEEPKGTQDLWDYWFKADVSDVLMEKVILMHCTSMYPTNYRDANIACISTLIKKFGLRVGYSDHTLDSIPAMAAVALGASVIEKHITLDNSLPGPDHAASLNQSDFFHYVQSIRQVEQSLGLGIKEPITGEIEVKKLVEKQLVVTRKIGAGSTLLRTDLSVARCGTGIPASKFWDVIGRVVDVEHRAGDVLRMSFGDE